MDSDPHKQAHSSTPNTDAVNNDSINDLPF